MVTRDFELPPLVRALLDAFAEGVVVFGPDGRVAFANEAARRAVTGLGNGNSASTELRPQLVALGGRVAPLRVPGAIATAEAVFLPAVAGARTLAERERQAIMDTLQGTSGKLAETARRLGISRTTLWRRLRAYGIERHPS
jgi:transcriptional regulator of acetoin/glycerol metabolism